VPQWEGGSGGGIAERTTSRSGELQPRSWQSTAAEDAANCGGVFTARNFTAQVLLVVEFRIREVDSSMSASKIAHRRLSGRAGSITQPITIAADVDRGAELIEVCRATPLDEARPANLVLVEAERAPKTRERRAHSRRAL